MRSRSYCRHGRTLLPPPPQRAPHPPRQHVRDQQAQQEQEQDVGRAEGEDARRRGAGRLAAPLPSPRRRRRRRQRAEPLGVALGDAAPRGVALGLRELVPVGDAADVAVRADDGRSELDELDALACLRGGVCARGGLGVVWGE